ncbi:TetR/AcrR family transcriptional regulator [Bacillus sp. EB600]|uniref:TetR/AcrR family transcriptional regulator n=1 Tax=Bacillus sp. EB600 TaxID=2806345 RepID=UPI002108B8AC|nr:TetR/AcrR family transcriptional regulator [Bacillus sp. EB600]MCQ6279232.1 TetR/AcrR family transcriptional regulator [Bacillus sp. EB600]
MSDREEGLVGSFPFIPKQERAQQKRKALLTSGRILFLTKGYEQTTAKEIASHAGVATGTFYRYFADKRQLLMALLEDHLELLTPPEPVWFNYNPESLLASLLETHYKQLNELGLYRVLPEILPKDSELLEALTEAKKKIHGKILTRLEQVREKGLTWKDLDLNTVAWTIMMLMDNINEIEEQSGCPINFNEIAKIICRLIYPPVILEQLRNGEKKI